MSLAAQRLALAKNLRRNATPSEQQLWSVLRAGRCGGFKFKRQVPISRFVADFACLEAWLIIEIDGESHDGTVEEDEIRSTVLSELGYHVIRFTNEDVHSNLEGVWQLIYDTCVQRIVGKTCG